MVHLHKEVDKIVEVVKEMPTTVTVNVLHRLLHLTMISTKEFQHIMAKQID